MIRNAAEREDYWQKKWQAQRIFAVDKPGQAQNPKYVLEMFPYPSGRIHMGHVRNYSIGDAMARFSSLNGYTVLHPIGWDAFGMPAENAAIKNNRHPADWTYENIATMRGQLKRLGFSYDWEREIATCHPGYYKHEQAVFLDMFKKGLAYRKKTQVNWCESCHTVLANEQVVDDHCWRCDGPVEMRDMDGWFLKITDYAEELLDAIDGLTDWPDKVRTMQRNWIGKSQGASVRFQIDGHDQELEIFTTRPDTLYGVTYMAISPEREDLYPLLADDVREQVIQLRDDVRAGKYAENEKHGIDTGLFAVHPFTNAKLPIYAANFVLAGYGTGAIMAVPAHDQRDFEFAQAFNLPIQQVILANADADAAAELTEAFSEPGVMINSAEFDGQASEDAKLKIIQKIESAGLGQAATTYRLRDWGISRQRYWGCPIPVIYCEACGVVPVPKEQLPVLLPEDVKIEGKVSALAEDNNFVKTTCPKCGEAARRETDTFDTFFESSWYFLRYLSPRDPDRPVDPGLVNNWVPVHHYIGGVEHAVLHLLYSRFFTKVLRDLDYIDVDEPFAHLLTQGMVIKDGAKMSKSKGNVVDPDDMIERYGADTTRLFMLFAAPPEKDLDWQESGVEGMDRFLGRIERTFERTLELLDNNTDRAQPDSEAAKDLDRKLHATIAKMTEDIEQRYQFNTAIAALMELLNAWSGLINQNQDCDAGTMSVLAELVDVYPRLMVPFAPHIAEELWHAQGKGSFVCQATWPAADPDKLVADTVEIPVQVNGKIRGRLQVALDTDKENLLAMAKQESNVVRYLENHDIVKEIVVPNKMVNLVIKPTA